MTAARKPADRIEGEGLRARKRRLTRSAIMASARALFAEHGIDKASMEAIAQQADISIASLYNYFPSKDLLLSELIIEGLEQLIAEQSTVFDRHYASAGDGYMALMRLYLEWFDTVERSWLRRFLAHATAQVDLVGSRYVHIATTLRREVHRMTGVLAERGLFLPGLDRELVSSLVWSIANSEFYAYVGSDKADCASFCKAFGAQLAFLLHHLGGPQAGASPP